MTKEEKDLLFIDLSARMPHGVMLLEDLDKTFDGGAIGVLHTITFIKDEPHVLTKHSLTPMSLEEVRPYLRPFEDMSEEEKRTCGIISCEGNIEHKYGIFYRCQDYLNSRHIDYRGLISKGLALTAPKDMYKFD